MKLKSVITILSLFCWINVYSQVDYNANTKAGKFSGTFLYGSNMAYKNDYWKDTDVADLLVGNPLKGRIGVGAVSLRPALYEFFVELYGYNIRVKEFQYYRDMGSRDNVIFIGGEPASYANGGVREGEVEHQEYKSYYNNDKGQPVRSLSYENLYKPIWIEVDGKKVVNPENYYAASTYRLIETYKDFASFYEIVNEPDYTYMPNLANAGRGVAGNWWENNPQPAALHNWRAPIQSYIRLLRVSYEVIKTLDPDALVCVGGVGYPSFLDAIMRNTDNPDEGKVTSEYPLKGGAWFDCLSYHTYPMYSLRKWVGVRPENPNGFEYFRHSDAAVKASLDLKTTMEDIMAEYGYGTTYPEKVVIITEANIPSKIISDYIGGETEQRNYLMKLAIAAQKVGVSGIYPYCPWDDKELNEDGDEYKFQGFYKPIPDLPSAWNELREHESAEGWRTMSRMLDGKRYNAKQTAVLHLPTGVTGAVFGEGGSMIYALWAETSKDMDESSQATFTLPSQAYEPEKLTKWNSGTKKYATANVTGRSITLNGEVCFYSVKSNAGSSSVPATSISTTERPEVTVGSTTWVNITFSPENATDRILIWSSSASSIAKVDENGTITGVAEGTATITVTTTNAKSTTFQVTVNPAPVVVSVTKISIAPYTQDIKVGENAQMTATIEPANATDKTLYWFSSSNSIATVTQGGIVQGVAEGEAWINVAAVNGGNSVGPIATKVTVVSKSVANDSATKGGIKINISGADGTLNIRAVEPIHSVKVYSLSGQLLKSLTLQATEATVTGLPEGVLLLNVDIAGQVLYLKFVMNIR